MSSKLKRLLKSTALACIAVLSTGVIAEMVPADYVNPFIGTDEGGDNLLDQAFISGQRELLGKAALSDLLEILFG